MGGVSETLSGCPARRGLTFLLRGIFPRRRRRTGARKRLGAFGRSGGNRYEPRPDPPGYRGAEGKLVSIPYKGEVEGTLTEILGGLRSTCTYIGAKRIKDMPKCTTFVRCTQQVNQVFNQFNAD